MSNEEYERQYGVLVESDSRYWDFSMASGPYVILQIGDLVAKSGYSGELHRQFAHEYTYIVSGTANIICDNEQIKVSQGDIIFNPQNSLHKISCCNDENNLRFQFVGFNIKETNDSVDKQLYSYLNTSKWKIAKASPSVVSAFEDILSNRFINDEFQKKIAEDSLRKLIISAKRCFESIEQENTGSKRPEINMLLLKICTFIDTNCKDINILKELPSTFGYSYSHLSSIFSKHFGMSLKKYLLMRRHNLECQMLLQGISVTEIAGEMGYSSIHSFSHAFIRYCGISPSDYALKYSKE